ncbi:restriction endonuclease subunit S [Kitasatospora sp. NPDC057692]|uniref:restriction endonuclease subunit S n=1 Tax=Kitasatospora sp. NPDC057692 TaxID=3346215 RepID=UPI0036C8000F
MADWPFVEYQSLASPEDRAAFAMGPFGPRITKDDFVREGVPVIRGVNLVTGVLGGEFAYVSEEKADEVRSANAGPGDIVLTHRGAVGRVSVIPHGRGFSRYVIDSAQLRCRLDRTRAVPEFYHYWFRSEAGRRSILAQASAPGRPGMAAPLTSIRTLRVPCPPLAEQQAVADVLGALDDKIAGNDDLVAALHELGLAHFDRAVESDGSVRVAVGSVVREPFRGTASGELDVPGGVRVIDRDCIRDGQVSVESARRVPAQEADSTRMLRRHDVLVAPAHGGGPGRGARWTSDAAAVADARLLAVRFAPELVDPVCAGLAVLRAQPRIDAAAEGASRQAGLRETHLARLELVLPGPARRPALRAALDALENRADEARRESDTLAELRDSLIPHLMTGWVRVRDLEAAVEGAT